MSKLKAGGVPPTELSPLPTDAELNESHRQFQRDVIAIYVIVIAVIGAIAFFA